MIYCPPFTPASSLLLPRARPSVTQSCHKTTFSLVRTRTMLARSPSFLNLMKWAMVCHCAYLTLLSLDCVAGDIMRLATPAFPNKCCLMACSRGGVRCEHCGDLFCRLHMREHEAEL